MKRLLPALALLLISGCTRSESQRLPPSASRVAQSHAVACDEGDPVGCYALGLIYKLGDDAYQGVPADEEHARQLFSHACELGSIPEACAELEE